MQNEETPYEVPHLGDARLDGDHSEMQVLIQALRHAVDHAATLKAFDALHVHVRAHFEVEDELMAPVDFSSKDCHVDEHAAVLKSFDEIRLTLVAGRGDVVSRFADRLLAWLPEHVDALDRQLAKFIFLQKTGGAAVLLRR